MLEEESVVVIWTGLSEVVSQVVVVLCVKELSGNVVFCAEGVRLVTRADAGAGDEPMRGPAQLTYVQSAVFLYLHLFQLYLSIYFLSISFIWLYTFPILPPRASFTLPTIFVIKYVSLTVFFCISLSLSHLSISHSYLTTSAACLFGPVSDTFRR